MCGNVNLFRHCRVQQLNHMKVFVAVFYYLTFIKLDPRSYETILKDAIDRTELIGARLFYSISENEGD